MAQESIDNAKHLEPIQQKGQEGNKTAITINKNHFRQPDSMNRIDISKNSHNVVKLGLTKNRTSRLTEIWGIPCSAPKRRDVRDTTTPLAHGTDPLRSTTKKLSKLSYWQQANTIQCRAGLVRFHSDRPACHISITLINLCLQNVLSTFVGIWSSGSPWKALKK